MVNITSVELLTCYEYYTYLKIPWLAVNMYVFIRQKHLLRWHRYSPYFIVFHSLLKGSIFLDPLGLLWARRFIVSMQSNLMSTHDSHFQPVASFAFHFNSFPLSLLLSANQQLSASGVSAPTPHHTLPKKNTPRSPPAVRTGRVAVSPTGRSCLDSMQFSLLLW